VFAEVHRNRIQLSIPGPFRGLSVSGDVALHGRAKISRANYLCTDILLTS